MRTAALATLVCCLVAGCGGTTADVEPAKAVRKAPAGGLRVAVLGHVRLPDSAVRSPLRDAQLAIVARHVPDLDALARTHPAVHFAVLGERWTVAPLPNVTGVRYRLDQAAYLAGVVAGLVTAEEGGLDPAIAWVGGRRRRVTRAYLDGARAVDPGVRVEAAPAGPDPALCKEAAIDRVARGAVVVLAGTGPCADGALAAAQEQNVVGLRLSDFVRPAVAVAQLVRDARRGIFHGGEDVVFGAASGAVGVGRLDPRIPPDAADRARQVEQELASGLRSPG